ncbi:MAG: universal stress protein [Candidatus Acidiferrales bacterium]
MLPPKLILVPIDFSDPSRAALDAAVNMASRLGSEILLVHVVPAIPDLPKNVSIFKEGQYDESLNEKAEKQLKELADLLAQKNIKARTQLGNANDVAMELIRIADSANADMIIIATHGMTGWRKIAFGSVAEKVVEEAECPVLVLRTKAATGARDSRQAASSTKSN